LPLTSEGLTFAALKAALVGLDGGIPMHLFVCLKRRWKWKARMMKVSGWSDGGGHDERWMMATLND